MIVIDMPRLFERPHHLVLAFMAGLCFAAGRSGRCYIEGLESALLNGDVPKSGVDA
jgi:hypothetical protein